jgi:hypothetical protein
LTIEEQYFLNLLEEAVAKLSFDGKIDEAEPLSRVVEYLQNEEPEIAYLEGEASGVNPSVLSSIKKIYKILY